MKFSVSLRCLRVLRATLFQNAPLPEILRYTNLAALIQMAKSRGWSDEKIARELSGGFSNSFLENLAMRFPLKRGAAKPWPPLFEARAIFPLKSIRFVSRALPVGLS